MVSRAYPLLSRRELLRLGMAGAVWLSAPVDSAEARGDGAPELLIRNGRVVAPAGTAVQDVRIAGEKIVELGRDLARRTGSEEIDATGLEVLPGGIDPHVHLRLPESYAMAWADDFTSGSNAALAGGITTLGHMSVPEPGAGLLDTLQREREIVARDAICDVFVHVVLLEAPLEALRSQLPALAAAGQPSIKIFTNLETFDGHLSDWLRVLEWARNAGVLTLVHCEDQSTLRVHVERLIAAGRGGLESFAESRPPIVEVAATQRAAALCEAARAPIYVVHVSCARALEVCEQARTRGLPFFVETRPIYLHLTREHYERPDGRLAIGVPPLREAGDVAALWSGLARGAIDTLGSDHVPWTREQKLDPALTVAEPPAGMSNLQVMLPMLYSEGVRTKRISLERFAAVTSTNPARLFGLYPRKGAIAPGADADLVLWDPARTRPVRASDGFSRTGFSIYEGTSVTGWPRTTIRRGAIVYDEGSARGKPGGGQLLRRRRWSGLEPADLAWGASTRDRSD